MNKKIIYIRINKKEIMLNSDKIDNPPRSLKRTLLVFIGNVIGLYIVSFFGLGVHVEYFDDIFLLVIFIGIINSLFCHFSS